MHRIDTITAVAVMPVPAAPGAAGYFTGGTPGPGAPVPATNFDADWCNAQQEELMSILTAAGVAPDKTKVNQVLSAIQILTRIKLTADTTFYVATTGNDANDGLTAGTPWATLQHAADVLATSYDFNGKQVTIQLADGNYAAAATFIGPFAGIKGKAILINGNAITPTNVVVQNTISASYSAPIQVKNFKVASVGTGLQATAPGGVINVGVGMVFGPCTGPQLYANGGGLVSLATNCTINGGASNFILGQQGNIFIGAGITITLTGTPAFSSSFIGASDLSSILFGSGVAVTWVGGATGTRYALTNNSSLNTQGQSSTWLPGNGAGTTATGGQYA
jgi:hypothetical protein